MKKFGKGLLYLLLTVALLSPLVLMAQYFHKPFGHPPKQEPYVHLSYYHDGKFLNPVETPMLKLTESLPVMKRYLSRKVEKAPIDSYHFAEEPLEAAESGSLHLNWLGHAAVLIKSGDTYLLTDPVLIGRASPFSFVGPKPFFTSPIAPESLPEIDAVIISHDHYDHLSYKTLIAIQDKVKRFLIPLGVGAHLRHWGIPEEKIQEIDWWDTYVGKDFTVTAAPARHFSGRFLTQNNTFWASWVFEIGGKTIYFGGDSGYFPGYEEIGKELGPFDISLMPIGAYDTAWANIHLNPEEALQAHREVQGGILLPIHWGTYDLALHSWYEPMELLIAEAAKTSTPLLTPKPGQWVTLNSRTEPYWWQQYRKTAPNSTDTKP